MPKNWIPSINAHAQEALIKRQSCIIYALIEARGLVWVVADLLVLVTRANDALWELEGVRIALLTRAS